MHDMHPHWQEEDETPVEVRVKEPTTPEPPKAPGGDMIVSRRPAAIVGMLIVIGIGFVFFRGVDNLRGQVAPSGQMVIINDEGVVPNRLKVEHGQTITFLNNQSTPHRIESNTLCSDTGFCLQTKTLNMGESDTFTITPDMRSGPYEFASTTSGDVRGVIIIVTDTVDDFVDLTSVLPDNFTPSPSNIFNATTASSIPRNPYTVDSERTHPFDSVGDSNPTPAQAAFSQTGGPIRQPETGPGVLVVLLGSVAVLWWATRDLFAQTSV